MLKLQMKSLILWRAVSCVLLLVFLLGLQGRAAATQRDQDMWVAKVLYQTGQSPDGGFETQALLIFANELYKQDASFSPDQAITAIKEIRRHYRALLSGAPALPEQISVCGASDSGLSAQRRAALQPLIWLRMQLRETQGLVTKYAFAGDKKYYELAQHWADAVALTAALFPDPTLFTKVAAAGIKTVSLIAKGVEDFTATEVKPSLDMQVLPTIPVTSDFQGNITTAIADTKQHLDTNANFQVVYNREFTQDTGVPSNATANKVLEDDPTFADALGDVNQTLSDVQLSQEEINASLKKVTDTTNQIALSQLETTRQLEDIDQRLDAVQGDLAKERELRQQREAVVASQQDTVRKQDLQLQAAGSSVYLLSTAARLLGSPEAARDISIIGGAGIKIAKAFIAFNSSSDSGGGVGGLVGAILTGNLVSAALDIFSLFGGDTGPSMDQQILDQVNQLGEQINELGRVMESRFDRIDETLNKFYKEMNSRFDDIANQIDHLASQLDQSRESLQRLEIGLNRLDQNLQTYLDALGRRELTLNLNLTLDWDGPMAWNTGTPNWVETSNFYDHWSTTVSRDAVQIGPSNRPIGDADIVGQLVQNTNDPGSTAPIADPVGNTHLDYNLNYLLHDIVENKFGLPSLTSGLSNATLANPRDWAIAANAYYDLAKRSYRLGSDNTTKIYHFDQDTTALADVNQMISTGQDLQRALQNISTVSTSSGRRANYRLFDALTSNYRAQIPVLLAAIQATEKPYVVDRRAAYTEIVRAFSLAGDVSQAGKSLDGGEALLSSFSALGLPASLQDNTELRASLYGSGRVLGQEDVIALYNAALAQSVVPWVDLKSVLEARITRYERAVEGTLDFVDANPWYETYSLIDVTLSHLNELKNRKLIGQATGTFSISGRVYEDKNGNGQWDNGEQLSDIEVSRTGVDSSTSYSSVLSRTDGTYTFTGLPVGTYTLSAGGCGTNILFMPVTQEVTITNANATNKNFVGVRTPAIAGRIVNRTVAPMNGATVTVSGGGKTYTTKSGIDGYYAVGSLSTGVSYSVSASNTNYGFVPSAKTLKLAQSTSIGTANFTGLPAPCVVGRVTNLDGLPLAGVTVQRQGGGRADASSAITDSRRLLRPCPACSAAFIGDHILLHTERR